MTVTQQYWYINRTGTPQDCHTPVLIHQQDWGTTVLAHNKTSKQQDCCITSSLVHNRTATSMELGHTGTTPYPSCCDFRRLTLDNIVRSTAEERVSVMLRDCTNVRKYTEMYENIRKCTKIHEKASVHNFTLGKSLFSNELSDSETVCRLVCNSMCLTSGFAVLLLYSVFKSFVVV